MQINIIYTQNHDNILQKKRLRFPSNMLIPATYGKWCFAQRLHSCKKRQLKRKKKTLSVSVILWYFVRIPPVINVLWSAIINFTLQKKTHFMCNKLQSVYLGLDSHPLEKAQWMRIWAINFIKGCNECISIKEKKLFEWKGHRIECFAIINVQYIYFE